MDRLMVITMLKKDFNTMQAYAVLIDDSFYQEFIITYSHINFKDLKCSTLLR